MAEYVSRLDDGDETKLRGLASPASSGDGSSNGTFFRAVLLVRRAKVHLNLQFCTLNHYNLTYTLFAVTYFCLCVLVDSTMRRANTLKELENVLPQNLQRWYVFISGSICILTFVNNICESSVANIGMIYFCSL